MLEVGAGDGSTSIYAKKHGYAKEIHAVELFEMKESNQESAKFKSFQIGNIESSEVTLLENHFDIILCGDVLEHLINPYEVIQRLRLCLKNDGVLIASIPNIREWNTLKTIFFKGDFKYVESGILDHTHLRFFTKKNILELFTSNGYKVENIKGSNTDYCTKYLKQLRLHKWFFLKFFDEFVNVRYSVVAKKD